MMAFLSLLALIAVSIIFMYIGAVIVCLTGLVVQELIILIFPNSRRVL